MNRLSLTLFIVLCTLFTANAQTRPLSTQSKKAEKFFLDAGDFYNGRDYRMALKAIDKALSEDNRFIEAWILKGDICSDENRVDEALDAYGHAMTIDPVYSPQLYYISGNLELATGRYSEARGHYLRFLEFPGLPEERRSKVMTSLKRCDFGITAVANPVPFQPVNLGDSVNSPDDEFINAITADDHKLFFTRRFPRNAQTLEQSNEFEEDFYFSERTDSLWRKALSLGPPINTHGNEGALCIAPDGRFLFFAACNRDDGNGSCDLYWSKREGNRWSPPENMGTPVNSKQWDSQPTFASDGKTLYFSSKREGGKGSADIWKTELQPDGTWSIPVNLGDSVNTRMEEMAPFIHPDDQTLYFASKGHPGMGGLDLFLSRRNVLGQWTRPVNLGYPINTFADEITLTVSASGDLAYISSDKLGGKGRQDIYSFPLYREARPIKVNYFKGVVFDADSRQRLAAVFELTDLATGKTVITSRSDASSGEFMLLLPANHRYALSVSREGYLFFSDHFEMIDGNSSTKPFLKDIPLQPIRPGKSVVLKNIFFDTDKYDLKPDSKAELDRLVALLKANPSLKIEVGGHTDSQGSADHNLVLSKNRAKAVYDYLVQSGITTATLSYNGYGQTKPIDTNDTDAGRANNRRTEFVVK